jgi:hypothetical protein
VIVTDNYGEAGAIDLLGRRSGLPRAYSSHNGYANCGRPPATSTRVLPVDYDPPAVVALRAEVDGTDERDDPGPSHPQGLARCRVTGRLRLRGPPRTVVDRRLFSGG